ncbi:hypothetical protein QBC37DRAFT_374452 [Rhypophila decipiens]|uniref:Uncharacterized protein n=1 Tax=Rhypophila decipiens TaxID=261697 RepID=A0AAN6Y5R8_9PEZI|nr:hypothetical protein QBC37DRAFT_374452 [Rhypophila decipiens]
MLLVFPGIFGSALAKRGPAAAAHRLGRRFPADREKLVVGYQHEELRQTSSDSDTELSLQDEVKRWVLRKNGGVLVTRFHAELQVAHFFNAMSLKFQDNDRYIGCSKGACWFCFHYLKNIPVKAPFKNDNARTVGFVEPSSHNVVIPGVGFPPVKSDGSSKHVERMRARMNDVVVGTIREVLLENVPKHLWHHPQSTDTWVDRTASVGNSALEELEDRI